MKMKQSIWITFLVFQSHFDRKIAYGCAAAKGAAYAFQRESRDASYKRFDLLIDLRSQLTLKPNIAGNTNNDLISFLRNKPFYGSYRS